jgi:replicative DNA helicase
MTNTDILVRVPPQAIEAEMSVLGAVLLDETSLDVALDILSADDFYKESHRILFRSMVELADRNIAIDAITLIEWLRTKNGAYEQVGGPAYIAELAYFVPTAANIDHYAKIVRDKAILRTLGTVATEIASGCYENPANAQDYLDQAEHRIFEISDRKIEHSFYGMPELTRQAIRTIERLYERKEEITGVPTGFVDIDRHTCGLQPSDLIVVAARPGLGKTAFALNVAAHATLDVEPRRRVAFFSLEMSKEQLMHRLICSEARIESARARSGFIGEREFPKLAQASARLNDAQLFIDDSSATTLTQLKARCRRLARERGGLHLVIVDYLQLVRSSTRAQNREREIAELTAGLKALAKDLKVPVLVLAQLNRQVEGRQDKHPILADLRESGAIEQDADVIAFIYRDEMYRKDSPDKGTAEVIIAKQRNGPCGLEVKLAFLSQYGRFENFIPESMLPENGNG